MSQMVFYFVIMIFCASKLPADAQFLQPHKEHSSPSVIIALKGSTIWLHWNYSYVGDTEKNKCKEQLVYCIGCHGVRAILRRKGATADLKHRVDRPGALPGIPAYLVNRIKVFPNNDSIAMRNMTLSDAGVYFVSVVYLEVKNETNNQTRVLAVLLQPIKIKIVVLEKMYIEPGRSYSSPRRIASKEGKSILLHWEYKYHGDTQKYRFKEQVIGYNSTGNRIFVPLAKRNRSNASLKLVDPLPTIFVGRLELSSNKMSIVINKSRFNDTQYRFFSYITMEHIYPKRQNLKFFFSNFSLPPILVEVTGTPRFTVRPNSISWVEENATSSLTVHVTAHPEPSLRIHSSFNSGGSPMVVTKTGLHQLYPYVYVATYEIKKSLRSYCGRSLIFHAENNLGSSVFTTLVMVKLKFDIWPDLQARQSQKPGCIDVTWKSPDIGLCEAFYAVMFINASGNVLYTEMGFQVTKTEKCGIADRENVIEVKLNVIYGGDIKKFRTNVTIIELKDHNNGNDTKAKIGDKSKSDKMWIVTFAAELGIVSFILLSCIVIIYRRKCCCCCSKKTTDSCCRLKREINPANNLLQQTNVPQSSAKEETSNHSDASQRRNVSTLPEERQFDTELMEISRTNAIGNTQDESPYAALQSHSLEESMYQALKFRESKSASKLREDGQSMPSYGETTSYIESEREDASISPPAIPPKERIFDRELMELSGAYARRAPPSPPPADESLYAALQSPSQQESLYQTLKS